MKLNTKRLQDIEYGLPVLEDKQVLFARVAEKTYGPSKKNPSSNTLKTVFQIVDPQVVKRGGDIIENKGNLKFAYYIGGTPSANYDPDSKLKELAVALGVPEDKEDFELDDIVVGTFLKIVIKFEPADGQYPDRNSVNGVRPIKPEDQFDPSAVPSF